MLCLEVIYLRAYVLFVSCRFLFSCFSVVISLGKVEETQKVAHPEGGQEEEGDLQVHH